MHEKLLQQQTWPENSVIMPMQYLNKIKWQKVPNLI